MHTYLPQNAIERATANPGEDRGTIDYKTLVFNMGRGYRAALRCINRF